MSDLRSLLPKELPESTLRSADLKDGRVVALAAVKAGDAVFSEKPYAISPMLKKGSPSCFGCCRVVSRPWPCGGCSVPLCCAACASSPFHREECLLMQRCGFRFQDLSEYNDTIVEYQQICVLLLRLLLQGEESGWGALKVDKSSPKGMPAMKALSDMFSLAYPPLLLFDIERTTHAYSVVNQNRMGFDRRLKGRAGMCVVRIAPRVGHSCVPNSSFHFWMPELDDPDPASMEKLLLVFSATVDVAAGDEVTMDKANQLMSDAGRYRQAKDTQPKDWACCRCRRCRDGTDFGLFLGSPCCLICKDLGKQSLMVPSVLRGGRVGRQPAQQPPCDDWRGWQCRTCKKRPTRHDDQEELVALNKKCYDMLGLLDEYDEKQDDEDDPLELERFLEENLYPRGLMHPNFCMVLVVKYRLSTEVLLGRKANIKYSRIRRMPADLLQRLEGHCRDVLAVMETLQVGLNWKRGQAMLGFSLLLRDKAQRSIAHALPTEETMETLAEAERVLRGAIQCLRWRRHLWPVLLREVDALENTKAVIGWLRLLPVFTRVQPSASQGTVKDD